MAELTGPVIVTNYGEQQLLAGTFDVTKIKLGSGIWSPTMASTALNTEEASIPASGAVEAEASGFRLRLAAVDDNDPNVYTLQEFALTDDTDVALAIYSQAAAIATKTSGVDLLFSINWLIDNTAGPITVTGATTYTLPLASQSSAGLIEIATDAEAIAGTDTTRAITASQGFDIAAASSHSVTAMGRVITGVPGTRSVEYVEGGLGVSFLSTNLGLTFGPPFLADASNYVAVATCEEFECVPLITVTGPATGQVELRLRSGGAVVDPTVFEFTINLMIFGAIA